MSPTGDLDLLLEEALGPETTAERLVAVDETLCTACSIAAPSRRVWPSRCCAHAGARSVRTSASS